MCIICLHYSLFSDYSELNNHIISYIYGGYYDWLHTILEYIKNGYDIQQIARAMCSDINLIALKVDTLIAQGYQLRKQEHQNDFLKYSKKI